MTVLRSVVKWFDAKKGYGFLVHPSGGSDIFIHYSHILSEDRFKSLQMGQVVEFELHDGDKGLHAQNLQAIETGPEPAQPESSSAETWQNATPDGLLQRRPRADVADAPSVPSEQRPEYAEQSYR